MVTRHINLIYFMLKSYIPQPQLFSPSVQFCHCYNSFFILASTWIQPSQPISTSYFWRKSLIYHWAVANQVKMFEYKLIERLLVGQRLSNLVVVEQEKLPQTLQSQATSEQPCFNRGRSLTRELSGNAKKKGLEVIEMVYRVTQIDPGGWLDASGWFMWWITFWTA